jgi:hypothetical protein
VLQEIPALTQIALVNGQVTDAQIESQLAGSGIVFIGKVKKESMAVSRLRAVWGNNDIFVATQVEIAAAKEEEAQEVEKNRETKLLARCHRCMNAKPTITRLISRHHSHGAS